MPAPGPDDVGAVLAHLEREIDRFLDLWKHTDGRVAGNFTVLIGVAGAAVSLSAIYGASSLRLVLIAFIAALLGAAMFAASFRIVGTDITKAEYLLTVNLLRGRIATLLPGVRSPTFIPPLTADGLDAEALLHDHLNRRLTNVPRRFMLGFTGVASGTALGFGVTAAAGDGAWPIGAAAAVVVAVLVVAAQVRSLGTYATTRLESSARRFEDYRATLDLTGTT